MTQDFTRSDSQDPKEDVITNVITTDNTGGGGSEQQVQALFKARAHVDVGVTKTAERSLSGGEIDDVREGARFVWAVRIKNHSDLPIQAGDLKLTDVLPEGFEYETTIIPFEQFDVQVRPPADGHGPTVTYTLHEKLRPGGSILLGIFGEQDIPDDLEEQVVQNHATVKHRDQSVTDPTPDPHPNDVYAPLTVRARNN